MTARQAINGQIRFAASSLIPGVILLAVACGLGLMTVLNQPGRPWLLLPVIPVAVYAYFLFGRGVMRMVRFVRCPWCSRDLNWEVRGFRLREIEHCPRCGLKFDAETPEWVELGDPVDTRWDEEFGPPGRPSPVQELVARLLVHLIRRSGVGAVPPGGKAVGKRAATRFDDLE